MKSLQGPGPFARSHKDERFIQAIDLQGPQVKQAKDFFRQLGGVQVGRRQDTDAALAGLRSAKARAGDALGAAPRPAAHRRAGAWRMAAHVRA